MKKRSLRELLLLAVFLGFVIRQAYDAVHVRFGRMERFEVTAGDLETWAKQVDPTVRFSAIGDAAPASVRRTTPMEHWEFEVAGDQIEPVVEHWRLRVAEKLQHAGWREYGNGHGNRGATRHFHFQFSKSDSRYVTYLYAEPATATHQKPGGRVRLSVEWIALGYTRLHGTLPATSP